MKSLYGQNVDLRGHPHFEKLQLQRFNLPEHSPSPLLEIVQQINRNTPLNQQTSIRALKTQCFQRGVIEAPINEEIFFRGIVQGLLLYRIPAIIFQEIAINKSRVCKSVFAPWARTIAVAGLFASAHQDNEPSTISQAKTAHAFFLGLELGLIKESRLKLAGAIGAHMANNCISLKHLLTSN